MFELQRALFFFSWDGIGSRAWGAAAMTEEEEIAEAAKCGQYEFGTPECLQDDEDYCPCSSNRDYSPSNPWDTPGMSIRDFI